MRVARVPAVPVTALRATARCRVRPRAVVARALPAPVVPVQGLVRVVPVPVPARVVRVPAGRVPTR
ncbi:hypothetical protein H4W81_005316 [Nonomuraea africana]|uniref:Uncharacterized protein n=1 Tax=Nonomuraea africana TaxID=46171 RepID=A0ABR9KKJ0_9ACTN|nr:hypothetical protein [Nonomuraea africana]